MCVLFSLFVVVVDFCIWFLQLPIIGKNNYIKVMQYAGDLMAGEILRHGPAAEAPFKKCLNNINNLMRKFLFSIRYLIV